MNIQRPRASSFTANNTPLNEDNKAPENKSRNSETSKFFKLNQQPENQIESESEDNWKERLANVGFKRGALRRVRKHVVDEFKNYIHQKKSKLYATNRQNNLLCSHSGLLSYYSERGDPKINLNCKIDNSWAKKIINKKGHDGQVTCRHFAFEQLKDWQSKREDSLKYKFDSDNQYHEKFKDEESIQKVDSLMNADYDMQRVMYRADKYVLFDIKDIGEALHSLCNELSAVDPIKTLTFGSENHLMSMKLQRKESPLRYIINFYDPNKTTAHLRIVCKSLFQVRGIKISNLLFDRAIQKNFSTIKAGVFAVYNNVNQLKAESDDKVYEVIDGISPGDLIWSGLSFGINVFDKIKPEYCDKNALLVKSAKKVSGLSLALSCCNNAVVTSYVKLILASGDITTEEKVELLIQEGGEGSNGLVRALNQVKKDIVKSYVKLILKSDLPTECKSDFIKTYIKAISMASNKLSSAAKLKLVQHLKSVANSIGLASAEFEEMCTRAVIANIESHDDAKDLIDIQANKLEKAEKIAVRRELIALSHDNPDASKAILVALIKYVWISASPDTSAAKDKMLYECIRQLVIALDTFNIAIELKQLLGLVTNRRNHFQAVIPKTFKQLLQMDKLALDNDAKDAINAAIEECYADANLGAFLRKNDIMSREEQRKQQPAPMSSWSQMMM